MRRSQLERRRLRAQESGTFLSVVPAEIWRQGAQHGQEHRQAVDSARFERAARAEAERRSNDLAIRALEAERTQRLEAERLLRIERAAGIRLRDQIQNHERKRFRRYGAATRIQSRWRGYWTRVCMAAGRAALMKLVVKLQAYIRGIQIRKQAKIQREAEFGQVHKMSYFEDREKQRKLETFRVRACMCPQSYKRSVI